MKKLKKFAAIVLAATSLLAVTPANASEMFEYDYLSDENFQTFVIGSYTSSVNPLRPRDVKTMVFKTPEGKRINCMYAVRNGVTLVELKPIAEYAGIDLQYQKGNNGKSQIYCARYFKDAARVVVLDKNNWWGYVVDAYYSNGDGYSQLLDLPEAVQLYNGRTFIPMRVVLEALGCTVTYGADGSYNITV